MIIVGVDGSAPARAAVEWAADDALRMHQPLRIVHAVDRSPYQIAKFPTAEWPDALIRGGEKALAEALAVAHERQPSVEATTRLLEGTPAQVLQDEGRDATEIVVGSRGLGGFAGALLGSVSGHVAGQAPCPVVVVRGETGRRHDLITVGVDDSPACEPALPYAFEQARLRGSAIRAVYAWNMPVYAFAPGPHDMDAIRQAACEVIDEHLERYKKEYPQVSVTEEVRAAHPVDALRRASAESDLLVIGSHGHGALASVFVGSVRRGVLHHAQCPVAVVRAR
ncbi:universal stress protein [Nonomuraea sp. SMC257]|uniref:Universal stress protein n=1 Tax=Nonomuraea montanisoli TaxID=2741721 RepID=A0A7Y6I6J0_9ACTN|nr:universal stress protein [Nonomuraea montanisoli]NUW31660.1 universal stress protein [Nonomuraea montanisoli]